jgi:hypothetical protein
MRIITRSKSFYEHFFEVVGRSIKVVETPTTPGLPDSESLLSFEESEWSNFARQCICTASILSVREPKFYGFRGGDYDSKYCVIDTDNGTLLVKACYDEVCDVLFAPEVPPTKGIA